MAPAALVWLQLETCVWKLTPLLKGREAYVSCIYAQVGSEFISTSVFIGTTFGVCVCVVKATKAIPPNPA